MFLLKNIEIGFVDGLLFSLVAILIVFVVLLIIIMCVYLMSKFKFKDKKKQEIANKTTSTQTKKLTIEDIEDEDMMVAALIATAEFVEETKEKDARLVNIKRIA